MYTHTLTLFTYFTLLFLFASCVSYDSPMQSAYTVKPGESTNILAFHYNAEFDRSLLSQRLKGDFGINFNDVLPDNGISIHKRWGIGARSDWGIGISLDTSSIDIKYNYLNTTTFASSIGPKILFPLFSIDEFNTYFFSLTSYNSYYLVNNFQIYLSPIYLFKPGLGLNNHYLGASFGLILGTKHGLLFEWTYYELLKKTYKESIEQLKFGYIYGLDQLNHNNKKDNSLLKVEGVLGITSFPAVGGGVALSYPLSSRQSLELSTDFGVAKLSTSFSDTSTGIIGTLMIHANYRHQLFSPHSHLALGVARNETRVNAETSEGWRRILTRSYGLEIYWEYGFENFSIIPLGFYVPLSFLPQSIRYTDGSEKIWIPPQEYRSFAENLNKKISFSLCKLKYRL